MFRFFIGTFIALHGLVHLWYFTLSRGLVAFKPEMGWSGRSWLFSPLLGSAATRSLGSILYVVATVAFVSGAIAFLTRAGWAAVLLSGAALLSSVLILLFWEGGLEMWMQKGLIGLLINVTLLLALWVARPSILAI